MDKQTDLVPDDIAQEFTIDGKNLLNFYLGNVKEKLLKKGVSEKYLQRVFQGMYSYIHEFVDDESNSGLITYSQTLRLIDNLGMPTEIETSIQHVTKPDDTLDVQSTQLMHHCNFCNYANDISGPYCQNCGSRMNEIPRTTVGIKQFSIDHPYFMSLLGTYVLLVTFSLIWDLIIGTDKSFSESLGSSISRVFLPSIILALIFGYIISSSYKHAISFEEKYKKAKEKYDEVIFWFFIIPLIVFGPIMGIFAIITIGEKAEYISAFPLTFSVYVLVHLIYMIAKNADKDPKPEEISYHTLITYKSQVDEVIYGRIKSSLPKGWISSLIVFILFFILSDFVTSMTTLNQILISLIVGLYSFVVYASVISTHYYSWPDIKQILKEYDLKA